MKSIQTLIETLKDLIAEATQSRSEYNNRQLIPIPVPVSERKLPNNQHIH